MDLVLDVLLFLARVILVTLCAHRALFVITGTAKTYSEFSEGYGGLLYILGIVVDYMDWEHIVPGRDISRVMCAVGFALASLPLTLKIFMPTLYERLRLGKTC